jgi:hypothetical protein
LSVNGRASLLPVTVYLNIYLCKVSLQVTEPPLARLCVGQAHDTSCTATHQPLFNILYAANTSNPLSLGIVYPLNNNPHTTLILDNGTPQNDIPMLWLQKDLKPACSNSQVLSLRGPKEYKNVFKHIQRFCLTMAA